MSAEAFLNQPTANQKVIGEVKEGGMPRLSTLCAVQEPNDDHLMMLDEKMLSNHKWLGIQLKPISRPMRRGSRFPKSACQSHAPDCRIQDFDIFGTVRHDFKVSACKYACSLRMDSFKLAFALPGAYFSSRRLQSKHEFSNLIRDFD